MRLALHLDSPGELNKPGASDVLSKAIRELRRQVALDLPGLPGDGETVVGNALAQLLIKAQKAHAYELVKSVAKAVEEAR